MSKVLARARPTGDPQETGIDMFPTLSFLLWGLYRKTCTAAIYSLQCEIQRDTTIALPSAAVIDFINWPSR